MDLLHFEINKHYDDRFITHIRRWFTINHVTAHPGNEDIAGWNEMVQSDRMMGWYSTIQYGTIWRDTIWFDIMLRFKIRYDCTHPEVNHTAQGTKFTHPTVKHRLRVPGISCCARRRASTTTFPSRRRTTGTRSWGRNLRWDWSVNNPPRLSNVRLKTPAGTHTRLVCLL